MTIEEKHAASTPGQLTKDIARAYIMLLYPERMADTLAKAKWENSDDGNGFRVKINGNKAFEISYLYTDRDGEMSGILINAFCGDKLEECDYVQLIVEEGKLLLKVTSTFGEKRTERLYVMTAGENSLLTTKLPLKISMHTAIEYLRFSYQEVMSENDDNQNSISRCPDGYDFKISNQKTPKTNFSVILYKDAEKDYIVVCKKNDRGEVLEKFSYGIVEDENGKSYLERKRYDESGTHIYSDYYHCSPAFEFLSPKELNPEFKCRKLGPNQLTTEIATAYIEVLFSELLSAFPCANMYSINDGNGFEIKNAIGDIMKIEYTLSENNPVILVTVWKKPETTEESFDQIEGHSVRLIEEQGVPQLQVVTTKSDDSSYIETYDLPRGTSSLLTSNLSTIKQSNAQKPSQKVKCPREVKIHK